MGLAVSSAQAPTTADAKGHLSSHELIEIYRLMYLSRRIDDREILLKRQQKTFFQISAAGHEALQVGAALALAAGLRLVFSLLSRPRIVPGAGRDADGHVAAGGGRGDRSGERRAADADALEQPSRCTSSALPPRRRRRFCTPWDARRRGATSARHPEAAAKVEGRLSRLSRCGVSRRRSGAGLRGRRLDVAGRVLGSAEYGVESEAAGDLHGGR